MQSPDPIPLPCSRGCDALHPWDRGRLRVALAALAERIEQCSGCAESGVPCTLGQRLEGSILELSPRALVAMLHSMDGVRRTSSSSELVGNASEFIMMLLDSTLTTKEGCTLAQSADIIADLGDLPARGEGAARHVARLRAQAFSSAIASLMFRATDDGNAPLVNEWGVRIGATLVPF